MAVKHIFLAMLTRQDMHGYDIKTHYDALMLGETVLNFGQVYSTLLRLQRDGLIFLREDSEIDKKVYAITPAGKEALREWLSGETTDSMVLYDELSYKLAAMELLDAAQFVEIIQTYKNKLFAQMQRLNRKKRECKAEHPGKYLLLERNLLKLEADLLWSDKCLEFLKKAEGDRHA